MRPHRPPPTLLHPPPPPPPTLMHDTMLCTCAVWPVLQFLDDVLSASYGKLHSCGPTDLILLLTALGNLGYSPPPGREAFWNAWMTEFEKLTARKTYDTRGVCDLMAAMARLPRPMVPREKAVEMGWVPVPASSAAGASSQLGIFQVAEGDGNGSEGQIEEQGGPQVQQQQQQPVLIPRPPNDAFVGGVLRSTRMFSLRHTCPARLAGLAGSLAVLGIKPDFGFLYNYAQAARFMWSAFSTRDYATLLGAMVHIGTPGVADPRWADDFLAILMCRLPDFDGPGLAAILTAIRHLPKPEFAPGRQWLAAAAQRTVDLIRSPPPPPSTAAMVPRAAVVVPAADTSAAAEVAGNEGGDGSGGGVLIPTPGPLVGTMSYRAGGVVPSGGQVVRSPEGRAFVAPPMNPLTPEMLKQVVAALAALGYRAVPEEPLVRIVRNVLMRNAALVQAQDRVAAGAAAGPVPPLGSLLLPHQQQQQPPQAPQAQPSNMAAAAVAAAAFERANAAAAAAAAAGSEAPRPLLSPAAAAELESSLAVMLGLQVPLRPPSATATDLGLPVGAVRTPEHLARQEAVWQQKMAARKKRSESSGSDAKANESSDDRTSDDQVARSAGAGTSTVGSSSSSSSGSSIKQRQGASRWNGRGRAGKWIAPGRGAEEAKGKAAHVTEGASGQQGPVEKGTRQQGRSHRGVRVHRSGATAGSGSRSNSCDGKSG
ncbi:hypothetical protein Agub_g16065 [Astrephomene gubernaculifera]|uniref:Uncharacterized protein n=1 Tax=Astrephomene gubernaculifera TaxID=47775 RepID=A0AAD3E3Y7_9CHLO|nr:hypothetical protein Agub_g16065 [Astrephomene gubernaculifera]